MFILFDRQISEWVVRKRLLTTDDETDNMVFNLNHEDDCQRLIEILNEYEDEE